MFLQMFLVFMHLAYLSEYPGVLAVCGCLNSCLSVYFSGFCCFFGKNSVFLGVFFRRGLGAIFLECRRDGKNI